MPPPSPPKADSISPGVDLLVAAAFDSPVLGYMDPPVSGVGLRPRDFGRSCMRLLTGMLAASGARSISGSSDWSHDHTERTEVVEAKAPHKMVETRVIHRASTAGPLTEIDPDQQPLLHTTQIHPRPWILRDGF